MNILSFLTIQRLEKVSVGFNRRTLPFVRIMVKTTRTIVGFHTCPRICSREGSQKRKATVPIPAPIPAPIPPPIPAPIPTVQTDTNDTDRYQHRYHTDTTTETTPGPVAQPARQRWCGRRRWRRWRRWWWRWRFNDHSINDCLNNN